MFIFTKQSLDNEYDIKCTQLEHEILMHAIRKNWIKNTKKTKSLNHDNCVFFKVKTKQVYCTLSLVSLQQNQQK